VVRHERLGDRLRRKDILIDPWFGRFDSGFFSGKFNPNTPITTDQA